MRIEDWAPIPAARLRRMRWRGERTYRILSHSFSIRWNQALMADPIHYVFGAFVVPPTEAAAEAPTTSDGAARYSLVDLGPRHPRRYRLYLADEQLITSRSPASVVDHLLRRIIGGTQSIKEFLLIHAGSVVTLRGEAVLFPGDSGSGKTTLVAALIRDGFKFLSDEFGVIAPETGLVHPYPRALNFKDLSLPLFPAPPSGADLALLRAHPRYLRVEEIRPDVTAGPSELRFVIFPRYQEGAAIEVTSLSRAATMKELWRNAVNLAWYGARAVPVLANLARGVQGYRLRSGSVGEAARAVARLVGSSSVLPD